MEIEWKRIEKNQKSSKVNWNGVELEWKWNGKFSTEKDNGQWNGNGMEVEWKWNGNELGRTMELVWKWNEDGNIQKICYRIEDGIEMKLKEEWDFTQKKTKQKYRQHWRSD